MRITPAIRLNSEDVPAVLTSFPNAKEEKGDNIVFNASDAPEIGIYNIED